MSHDVPSEVRSEVPSEVPSGSPEALALATVRESPRLVGLKDKAAWLALFTEDARIEDPKGTLHARGPGAPGGHDWLARFWEVFIAPNDIRFEVERDAVQEAEGGLVVLRRVHIRTGLALEVRIVVPAVLRYELRPEPGPGTSALRVQRLEAWWDVADNAWQGLRQGPRGWLALGLQSLRMVRFLGLGGTLRYTRGLLRAPGLAGAPTLP